MDERDQGRHCTRHGRDTIFRVCWIRRWTGIVGNVFVSASRDSVPVRIDLHWRLRQLLLAEGVTADHDANDDNNGHHHAHDYDHLHLHANSYNDADIHSDGDGHKHADSQYTSPFECTAIPVALRIVASAFGPSK